MKSINYFLMLILGIFILSGCSDDGANVLGVGSKTLPPPGFASVVVSGGNQQATGKPNQNSGASLMSLTRPFTSYRVIIFSNLSQGQTLFDSTYTGTPDSLKIPEARIVNGTVLQIIAAPHGQAVMINSIRWSDGRVQVFPGSGVGVAKLTNNLTGYYVDGSSRSLITINTVNNNYGSWTSSNSLKYVNYEFKVQNSISGDSTAFTVVERGLTKGWVAFGQSQTFNTVVLECGQTDTSFGYVNAIRVTSSVTQVKIDNVILQATTFGDYRHAILQVSGQLRVFQPGGPTTGTPLTSNATILNPVVFTIQNAQQQPVVGANVTFGSQSGQTGAQGQIGFSSASGSFAWTITAQGFQSQSGNYQVVSGTNFIPITLQGGGGNPGNPIPTGFAYQSGSNPVRLTWTQVPGATGITLNIGGNIVNLAGTATEYTESTSRVAGSSVNATLTANFSIGSSTSVAISFTVAGTSPLPNTTPGIRRESSTITVNGVTVYKVYVDSLYSMFGNSATFASKVKADAGTSTQLSDLATVGFTDNVTNGGFRRSMVLLNNDGSGRTFFYLPISCLNGPTFIMENSLGEIQFTPGSTVGQAVMVVNGRQIILQGMAFTGQNNQFIGTTQ